MNRIMNANRSAIDAAANWLWQQVVEEERVVSYTEVEDFISGWNARPESGGSTDG